MNIYLATGNANKMNEFKMILQVHAERLPFMPQIFTAEALGGMPEVDENAGTYLGNAKLKADALFAKLGDADGWILADDSGFEVDALGGEPGVESAYFAGPEATHAQNNAKLLKELEGVPANQRGATYKSVLYLKHKEHGDKTFSSSLRGVVTTQEIGTLGWGYEPVFIPEGQFVRDCLKRFVSKAGREGRTEFTEVNEDLAARTNADSGLFKQSLTMGRMERELKVYIAPRVHAFLEFLDWVGANVETAAGSSKVARTRGKP